MRLVPSFGFRALGVYSLVVLFVALALLVVDPMPDPDPSSMSGDAVLQGLAVLWGSIVLLSGWVVVWFSAFSLDR